MRTPNFAERLSTANAAKKAQLERARRIADDPERAERLKAREEMIAARNHRVAEREVARRVAEECKAAELAASKLPRSRLAKPNVRRGKRPRRGGWPSRPRGRRPKPPSGRQSSPLAERAGRRKSVADIRGRDRRPASGKFERANLDSAHPPGRPHQCFVLVHPILLLGQYGNALLAFLLSSNITHNAIDSDGVATLVEALDYDCSLMCFHGDNVHFLMFVFSYLAQGPCRRIRQGKPNH